MHDVGNFVGMEAPRNAVTGCGETKACWVSTGLRTPPGYACLTLAALSSQIHLPILVSRWPNHIHPNPLLRPASNLTLTGISTSNLKQKSMCSRHIIVPHIAYFCLTLTDSLLASYRRATTRNAAFTLYVLETIHARLIFLDEITSSLTLNFLGPLRCRVTWLVVHQLIGPKSVK